MVLRNEQYPHRVDVKGDDVELPWNNIRPHRSAAEAHAEFARIISSPRTMRALRHVRLYINGGLHAERVWREPARGQARAGAR